MYAEPIAKPSWMTQARQLLQRLRLLPQPRPLLMQALLWQVPRLRTVHQLHQLRNLAAFWLAAPQMRQLDQHLQQRLEQLAPLRVLESPQRSQKSTSSRTRTGRRTGKRRR